MIPGLGFSYLHYLAANYLLKKYQARKYIFNQIVLLAVFIRQ